MGTQVERLARQRRTILAGTLVGFTLWQGGAIFREMAPANGFAKLVEISGELVGAIVWIVYSVRLRIWQAHAVGALGRAVGDELWRHRMLLSFAIAFFAIAFVQGAIIVIAIAAPTPPRALLAAQISIYIGVATAIGTFLYLDRE